MRHILHLFYPSYYNNHKARLLHQSSLYLMVGLVILFQIVLSAIPHSGAQILGFAANISIDDVVSISNAKRAEEGRGHLVVSSSLNQAARLKGEHMLANNYWAHVSPDGTEPWKFFGDVGYSYRFAGENLARDFTNPQSAVDAWMASPSHRENLLSTKYQEIGIAVVEGDLNGVDTTIIVQLFGTRNLADQISVPDEPAPETAQLVADVSLVDDEDEIIISPIPEQLEETRDEDGDYVALAGVSDNSTGHKSSIVSPFDLTRTVSLLILGLLLVALIIDGMIIFDKRIPRVGGRTLAHFAFLGAIFVIVVIARSGAIL